MSSSSSDNNTLMKIGLGAVALYATDVILRPFLEPTGFGVWGMLFIQAYVVKILYKDVIKPFDGFS
jgi:hypothetical protein